MIKKIISRNNGRWIERNGVRRDIVPATTDVTNTPAPYKTDEFFLKSFQSFFFSSYYY